MTFAVENFVSVTAMTSGEEHFATCASSPSFDFRPKELVSRSLRKRFIGDHVGHVGAQIRLISSGLQPLVGRGGSFSVFGHQAVEWR